MIDKQIPYYSYLSQALLKGLAATLFTIFLYQFFYIEYIRSNVEDIAFDKTIDYVVAKQQIDTNSSNTFVLMVDDKYLASKNLLDENNETNYGYIFPRDYLAQIILNVDALVADIDEENYPSALFLDYDFSYLSDPHNKVPSTDDTLLLQVLQKKRPYTIYLPMTSNYNYIYDRLKNSNVKFVSVGLTSAHDGLSRRYYPYEEYKDHNFTNIAIELYKEQINSDLNVTNVFSQNKISLVENRIIFKNKYIVENTPKYNYWQSNWSKLSYMSASYPLDMIYEDDLKGAVFMVGPTHSASDDSFTIYSSPKEISGVEMHANALMTLDYLDGKLKRLPLVWSAVIVFLVVMIVDFFLSIVFQSSLYEKIKHFTSNIKTKWVQQLLLQIVPSSRDAFFSRWLVIISIIILFVISYALLRSPSHYWFNWLIPSMMSIPYLLIMGIKKRIQKNKKEVKCSNI